MGTFPGIAVADAHSIEGLAAGPEFGAGRCWVGVELTNEHDVRVDREPLARFDITGIVGGFAVVWWTRLLLGTQGFGDLVDLVGLDCFLKPEEIAAERGEAVCDH